MDVRRGLGKGGGFVCGLLSCVKAQCAPNSEHPHLKSEDVEAAVHPGNARARDEQDGQLPPKDPCPAPRAEQTGLESETNETGTLSAHNVKTQRAALPALTCRPAGWSQVLMRQIGHPVSCGERIHASCQRLSTGHTGPGVALLAVQASMHCAFASQAVPPRMQSMQRVQRACQPTLLPAPPLQTHHRLPIRSDSNMTTMNPGASATQVTMTAVKSALPQLAVPSDWHWSVVPSPAPMEGVSSTIPR